MLSVVLPILALAIALTPVVVSARVAYKREMAEQACAASERRKGIKPAEVPQPSIL